MVNALVIISVLVAIAAIGLGGAYVSGALDPLIQQLGVLLFKAKAEAEAKKLQAQGLTEGQDFVKGELAGSKQAASVKEGLGGIDEGLGGLKKGF